MSEKFSRCYQSITFKQNLSFLTISFQKAKITYRIGTRISKVEKRKGIKFGNKKDIQKTCIKSEVKWSESRSAVSNSLRPHGLYSPWNSPGQNTGVGSLFLLQGIFPTQGLNPGLPHCRWILYSWATGEAHIKSKELSKICDTGRWQKIIVCLRNGLCDLHYYFTSEAHKPQFLYASYTLERFRKC